MAFARRARGANNGPMAVRFASNDRATENERVQPSVCREPNRGGEVTASTDRWRRQIYKMRHREICLYARGKPACQRGSM